MRCQICNTDKLSKEFIPHSITPKCQHPRLICLRCASKAASTGSCPYQNCNQPISADSIVVKEFHTILNCLFREVYPTSDPGPAIDSDTALPSINVVMLTGERISFPFDPFDTVLNFKSKIRSSLHIDLEKQRLLYNENEITDIIEGKQAKLMDFGVKANSSIFLMIVLYSIPSHLNHVTFDLFWGYPKRGCDYLDASCLIFQGISLLQTVDWSHKGYGQAVTHSGDKMDHLNSKGHHTIQVYLQKIPANVTHLFFTLSAWSCPTISHYPNPSLRFFDATNPRTDLCSTTFTHARNSQAVIMCSVSRVGNSWKIFESGTVSAGNAIRYNPLVSTIQTLIQKGV